MSDLTPEERDAIDATLDFAIPVGEVYAVVERIVAAHVARATADAEARLALIRAECDAAEDHGIEDEDGERWVLVPVIRAALAAPTTDAATRRDDAGASRWERG